MWRASCASMAIMSDRGRVGWRRVAAIVLVVILIAELILGWGQLIAALSQLPQGVAALVLHSPEYLERFQLMTRGEQIRTLSRLTVTMRGRLRSPCHDS